MDEQEAFAAEVEITRRVLRCAELYEERQFEDLLGEADALTQAVPERGDGPYYRGIALCGLQRIDEGIAALREAVRLQPENAAYAETLAHVVSEVEVARLAPALNAALRGNQLQEAEELAARMVQLAPRSPIGYVGLALLHLRRGDLAGARRLSDEALRLDPEDELARKLSAELAARED